MFSDLKHALRQLTKSPGFTAIAVITLALGIGLNTSMFSLMNLLILQPLPFPDKDHLVRIYRTTPQTQKAAHSAHDFLELNRGTAEFAKIAAFRPWGFNLALADRPAVNLNGNRVSAAFFAALGMQPELGRVFLSEEDRPGNNVAIISHATWLAQFGGDPTVINRTVRLDGESITIIGVMPDRFSSVFLWGPCDIMRPLALTDVEIQNREAYDLALIGRYRTSDTLEQLNAQLATLSARLAPLRSAANSRDGLQAFTLQSLVHNPNSVMISFFMLGLAGFVLLIACANLANLLLARAVARAHEFAIRAALGSSRLRLLRPLLVESTILAVGGGIIGILVATWTNEWISRQLSANGFVKLTLVLDWRVVAFAFIVSLVTGLFFGLAPAWLMSRVNVNETLKSGGRSSTGDRTHHRFRNFLIVAQFSLALVLLSGAGFFIRGVELMLKRDVGWDTSRVIMAVVNLPQGKYTSTEQSYQFYTRVQERLSALPGAEKVSVAWTLPLFQYLTNRSIVADGRDAPPAGHEPQAAVNAVTPGYIDTLGLKLIAGRNFTEADKPGAPAVAIINESLARTLFPQEDPLGKRIGSPDPANRGWIEIVGVVADNGFAFSFSAPSTRSLVLRPLAQETWNYVTLSIRTESPAALANAMRQTIESLDSDLPLQMFGPVPQVIEKFASGTMMLGTVLFVFAALGLFLAAIGLYGVIANLVVQRTPEIGVRMALGAQPRDIIRLILGTGIRLTLFGTVFGLIGSYGISLVLKALNPSIASSPGLVKYDTPLIILGGVLLLFIAAALACWIPSRRATRVNPLDALRAE